MEGREKFPVVQVAWEDAVAFAQWAGKRLPTEAEWEYAARGGAMHQAFVWGSELTPGGHWFANVWQGPIGGPQPPADGFEGRAPVGSFRPNDYGLADMAGNVWEWTADWYRPDYYAKSVRKDPPGPADSLDPEEPAVPKRVARGGSFLSSETNGAGYRPSVRRKVAPAFASSELGFRCARSGK
jgi:formylglycine-generating enzyme required for sulfatase activity